MWVDADKAGLSMGDIDVFEVNEAFASQVAYCIKILGLPREKLNPNGTLVDASVLALSCVSVRCRDRSIRDFACSDVTFVWCWGHWFAGGAIALGHPLGCTGARQIATMLPELRRRHARYGVVSMCVGTGMGAAAVIENLIR